MCDTLWRHLVNAMEVTTGLAESNGSLPPVDGLTACTPGSAPGPTLSNEYGKLYLYLIGILTSNLMFSL